MKKIAVVTDSNAGITPEQAEELGCFVVPMPFIIDGEIYYENINLTQDKFYEIQKTTKITTSQPNINDVVEMWEGLLKEYHEVVHIPMSSGLSNSCETAANFAQQFEGRVQVVDNRRISVTLKQSVIDAINMAKDGNDAKEIKEHLESTAAESSIYIMVDTLKYLKQGGRISPAAAAIGTVLGIKPVLQIQGGKLETFTKVRNIKDAKIKMIEAIKKDLETRFATHLAERKMKLSVAHTRNEEIAKVFAEEIKTAIPGLEISFMDPLSLSVATHIGPNALAVTCQLVY